MMLLAAAIGAALLGLLLGSAAGVFVGRSGAREERDAAMKRAQWLEARAQGLDLEQRRAEERAADAQAELAELRRRLGLDGPRLRPGLALADLHATGHLLSCALADADGLPHAGEGPVDDVEDLAAFAAHLDAVVQGGELLRAVDEEGAELVALPVDDAGRPLHLLAESDGAAPLDAVRRCALRLGTGTRAPARPLAASDEPLLIDDSLTPVLRLGRLSAALDPSGDRGAFADDEVARSLAAALPPLVELGRRLTFRHPIPPLYLEVRRRTHTLAVVFDAGRPALAVAAPREGFEMREIERMLGATRRLHLSAAA